MADIVIEIDGKKITTQLGQNIIQVADANDVYIPRFCYHKKLSVAANCRMCLVEVAGAPKTLPACATPINDGMKVFTTSKKTRESQRAVMEFLLINHPLDCPICDQGGQCELQDFSLSYGQDHSAFQETKRSVEDQDLGPFIETHMTRCIHCTRCVRFGKEVAGVREMGATGRGEHTQIGTYVKHTVQHPLSGNIIDLCPVGALTSKPFRFQARAWEMQQHNSIVPHDCVGSHVHLHVHQGEVKRVVPAECQSLNETWIADRDRFSYLGLQHSDRLLQPKIKQSGQWQTVSWQVALNYVTEALQKIQTQDGGQAIGALVSPNATLEEGYVLQQLMRGLQSPNIDHRLRDGDHHDQAFDPVYPGFCEALTALVEKDAILLVGTNLFNEAPIIAHRVKQAYENGAKVSTVQMRCSNLGFPVSCEVLTQPSQLFNKLSQLLRACYDESDATLPKWLHAAQPDDVTEGIAKQLIQVGSKGTIIIGSAIQHHPDAVKLRYVLQCLSQKTGVSVNVVTEGANAAGLHLAGCVPHRLPGGVVCAAEGLSTQDMLQAKLSAYILHDIDPLCDVANPVAAKAALTAASLVVGVTAFESPGLQAHATVLLPKATFTEIAGSYINAFGDHQGFHAATNPLGEARPAWKIYRVLGSLLGLPDCEYQDLGDVQQALSTCVAVKNTPIHYPEPNNLRAAIQDPSLEVFSDLPRYGSDAIQRHSSALMQMADILQANAITMNTATASALNCSAGDTVDFQQSDSGVLSGQVVLDPALPDQVIGVCVSTVTAQEMGAMFGEVQQIHG